MTSVKQLRPDLINYLGKHQLLKKFEKQVTIFCKDLRHPSLHTEILEPKNLRLYSFRISRQYRVIFGYDRNGEVEIVDINNHYK